MNDNLLLIVGKSASGKSFSLHELDNPEGVMYLNTESGKKLPFPAKFIKGKDGKTGLTITDPHQVYEAFEMAEKMPTVHTIVVDSLTYLMDMYESMYVLTSANSIKAWGDFAQYYKKLMQEYVAKSTKNVIFIAHTSDALNESEMVVETKVPVKGSLKNQGIESYFSTVIAAKRVPLKALKDYKNDLLHISPREEKLGFKYVYQTQVTKDTVNERLRGPLGLFSDEETFIDNNAQQVLNRLHTYYQ